MVFFNCEACNETLKKNQVEKHFYKCRTSGVTCIDCSVTFYGNDFAAHTSCISEAEKYEKSLYKGGNKKKLNPQDAWVMVVEHAASHQEQAPATIRPYLSRLAELGNVPRNKKKFNNFIKNSLKIHNDKMIEDIFNYLEKIRNELCPPEQKKSDSAVTAAQDIEENLIEEEKKRKKEKKEKRKREDDGGIIAEVDTVDAVDAVDEEEKKRKKEKKEKRKREDDGGIIAEVDTVDAVDAVDEKRHKKDKKDKKHRKKKVFKDKE